MEKIKEGIANLEMKADGEGIGKGKMKIAQKVIFLFNIRDGFSTAISGGLHPNPSSNFQILNESFELSLECYGINKDQNVSGKILHFVNESGLYEVSILLLQNYEPPIIPCALNEVLFKLAGDDLSTMPTLIAPFVVPVSKLKHEKKYLVANSKVSVYGIKLGPTTDVTQALSSKLQKLPPSLQVCNEELALFLHLVTVMKFPAIVLIGQSGQHISNKTSKEEFQVIHAIGEQLASSLSINFSMEKISQNPIKISRDNDEAWRALYG